MLKMEEGRRSEGGGGELRLLPGERVEGPRRAEGDELGSLTK